MPWGIVYYQARDGSVPAEAFLDSCPLKVEATILAVLEAVRQAPPPQFSGGGKWEAMHGTMGGYYEIRVTGPARAQYRLFCRLENGTAAELAKTRLSEAADRLHRRHVQTLPHRVQRPSPCAPILNDVTDPDISLPNNNDQEEQAALAA